MNTMRLSSWQLTSSLLFFLLLAMSLPAMSQDDGLRQTRLEDLGRALYFDVNLSRNRTQSCATCHDPAVGLIDWRDSSVKRMASLGDDGHSLGDRNAPTAGYAALAPVFNLGDNGEYTGGQFWDGRAADLEAQAGGPPLNPLEMNMPDVAAVVLRLQENPNYLRAFRELFGEDIFAEPDAAYAAMAQGIAAFERTAFFSPFDSRYDRYLRGELEATREEALGMTLFFSNQFTNCNQCHQLNLLPETAGETFTNYRYRNIGTPVNAQLRQANGLGMSHIDHGLLEHPAVDDPAQDGRIKTPTLRNVAVTGPYMHNGVFAELETVIRFYNKYNARGEHSRINPETGVPWGEPEVPANLALMELESGKALSEREIQALVAFLRMLTDRRYEPLLEQGKPADPAD